MTPEIPEAAAPETACVIEVALVDQAAADLARTMGRTGMSRSDIVNRAITLYEFVDSRMGEQDTLILERADGTRWLVKLL